MDYIIYFIITIAILVFVHEFGHFAAAKLSGMRADVFAIGFGKRLFGYNKLTGFTFGDLPKDFDGQGNTDYRLCIAPLGGYVKIAGMVDESFDTEFADKEPQPYEFRAKSTGKKVFVITAGVMMNLLLALLVFWGFNFFQGKQINKTTNIGYVQHNSPAQQLGFQKGDKVLSVNDKKINTWDDVNQEIYINSIGTDLNFKVQRNNQVISIFVPRNKIPDQDKGMFLLPSGIKASLGDFVQGMPAQKSGLKKGDIILSINNVPINASEEAVKNFQANKSKKIDVVVVRSKDTLTYAVTPNSEGKIGVYVETIFTGEIEYKTFGFFESFVLGAKDIIKITDLTFSSLSNVFSGKTEFSKTFGGPIKIAQVAAKSANSGIFSFLYFLALLSLSLAIINILPFPVLDGGHLIIIIVEGILKKEMPIKAKVAIQNTGFVILLLLMAFIIYNDIISL
ncbi:MAG TPA: RIP metalloprotease RseP [Ignavibacteriaceae bacterium]|nr:RIP metalloprotease RseP [Ignavibacteriaceae bacterium]